MRDDRPSTGALSGVLLLAVLSVSVAAPLVRLSSATPVSLAFWRLLFSSLITGGFWWRSRRLGERMSPTRPGDLMRMALAGVLLAVHFASWIASLGMTSVAASVVLVNTQPIFAAVLATTILAEPLRIRQWLGIGIAVVGTAVIAGDGTGGPAGSRPLAGSALALLGAACAAGYYVVGRSVRRRIPLWPYVTRVYGVATLTLLVIALATGERLAPWPAADWGIFLLLALGPGLLGHTLLNWSLRWLSAPVVNIIALGEPVFAAALAALIPAIAEVPGPWTLVGGGITLAGIGVVVATGGSGPVRRRTNRPVRSGPLPGPPDPPSPSPPPPSSPAE